MPVTPGALVQVGKKPPHDQVGDAETMEDMLDALVVDLEDGGARSLDDSDGPEVFPLTDDDAASQRHGRRWVLVPMPSGSPGPPRRGIVGGW